MLYLKIKKEQCKLRI